tara:strand:+ start:12 stop:1175 length:1164 start_codon:yes stop_codon:yes gene_type:complete
MLTKNVKFKSFKHNGKNNKIKKIIGSSWFKQIKLIKSFDVNFKYSYSKKDIKKYKRFNQFRVIGMGGSILGSEAIYQFLSHKIKKKFIFINNLKPAFYKNEKDKNFVNIIISKSGNTLETISNSNIILKKNNINKNIFVIENKNNYLSKIAEKIKAEVFEHKNFIGGRYSVLSEVGMLPAELMGLNEKKFKKYNYLIKNKKFINQLVLNVSSIISLIKKKKLNSIILNYDERSNNFFQWYQQLVAESLGKKSKGILPIISTMPRDNHSLMQLYLDGPKNNFYTFFNVKERGSEKINNRSLLKPYRFLKNKSLYKLINAQIEATKIVFDKKKLPFRSFEILNRSEDSMGELFCFFILETILLGRALNINPFDQPSVELIKAETKRILF